LENWPKKTLLETFWGKKTNWNLGLNSNKDWAFKVKRRKELEKNWILEKWKNKVDFESG